VREPDRSRRSIASTVARGRASGADRTGPAGSSTTTRSSPQHVIGPAGGRSRQDGRQDGPRPKKGDLSGSAAQRRDRRRHVDKILVLVVPDRHRGLIRWISRIAARRLGLGGRARARVVRRSDTGCHCRGSCGSGRRRRRSGGCQRRFHRGSSPDEPELDSRPHPPARNGGRIARPAHSLPWMQPDEQDLAARVAGSSTRAVIGRPRTDGRS